MTMWLHSSNKKKEVKTQFDNDPQLQRNIVSRVTCWGRCYISSYCKVWPGMTLQQTSCDVSSREQVREKDTWHSNRNEITFFTSVLQKDRFEQNRKLKLRGQIILLVTSHPACCFVSSIIFQKMGGLAV